LTKENRSGCVDLAGAWTLTDTHGDFRCDIVLPCDGITALHAAGHIPDPYWGRNEYDLRWIGERDWVVTRDVTLTETDVDLVISGIDTVATLRWNGQVVLQCDNVHRSFRVDLSDVAQKGENKVEITFHSPVAEGAKRQAAHPFPIPYSTDNNPIPNGNMLRKVQCDFGWDWNIALAPFGVVGGVGLEPHAAPRVDTVLVQQEHESGIATVDVTLRTAFLDAETATVQLCEQTTRALVLDGKAVARFTIKDPELWWPNGQGPQTLHDLQISVGDVATTRRIGLRTIELITQPDKAGASFGFRVNGRDVFAKGANWIPADALHGQITDEKTRGLLQSAADAHMNMIRVWGGGRYEPDSFYDTCDELGLMVWQDYMFACSIYPSDDGFLENVTAEVHENTARIQHHASLALWCGDNELVGSLGWFPETREDRDRYLVNYDRLNRTIETAMKSVDPAANWWPSSPSLGPMDFRDGWHVDGQGDMHFWSVWHEGRDFDHYRDVIPRFCSEFGFQSYPSMSAIRKFAAPEDFNIAAPVLESHQKNKGGNARIAETMFRYFRWPEKFEDFVYLSQVQQGLAIKTAVTHWRSLRPQCMGTLYWQLNDTWPVCSWASLDHGGNWKLLHHMAREFYRPVLVTAVPVGDTIVLRGVNDLPDQVSVSVRAFALAMDGERRDLIGQDTQIGEGAVEIISVDASDLGAQEMLMFTWIASDGSTGSDIHAPHPFKHYDLANPDITMVVASADGLWHLTVTSKAPAYFVSVESSTPGRFDQNAVHVLPDAPLHLTFAPQGDETPEFSLRDLHSATMATQG
jgi:beta-mannosidase